MRAVTQVRLGQQTKTTIEHAAQLEGVSTAQFIREAAYARAVVVMLERQDKWAQTANLMVALARRTRDPEVIRLTHLLVQATTSSAAAA